MTQAHLPTELRSAMATAREGVEALLSELADPRLDQEVARSLPQVWVASEFVARACRRDPELVRDIVGSGELMLSYVPGLLAGRLATAVAGAGDEAALGAALRQARNREMVRIAWRDLAGWATLEETLADLSDLADACIDAALGRLHTWHEERYGVARSRSGVEQRLVVLGMGKLGARELNFSSDVDLVFAWPEPGESDGPRMVSNEEYFMRLGQRLIKALDDVTEQGFVFRVDLRLRPFGESGPLAMSFDATEAYYQNHGREWERYALIKARPVAGDKAAGERLLRSLRPFVYRRFLDYGVFESLRELKARIQAEVERKGLESNIKLGRGGIREIEFVGQLFQLVRGGRDARFQQRGIQPVLRLLGELGSLPRDDVEALLAAYAFLRRVENHLQEWGDAQTHELPDDPLARVRLAWSMGAADWAGFASQLEKHRTRVQQVFDQTFVGPREGRRRAARDAGLDALWQAGSAEAPLTSLETLGFQDARAAMGLLERLRSGPAVRGLGEQARRRLDELVPAVLAAAGGTALPLVTLERLLAVIEAVARRPTYLALLVETPAALGQLTRLVAGSARIAAMVTRQPLLLDELIDPRIFQVPPTLDRYARELASMLANLDEEDTEARLTLLAEFQQASVVRVAAADIGGILPLMKVSDHLTEIAEVVVREVLAMAMRAVRARHGRALAAPDREAAFCVVAFGKLGGWELGYGSDLDLVFLHDAPLDAPPSDGERALEPGTYFMRVAQRVIGLLTATTASGSLYEVDTRLRPEGAKGLLVTSLEAFTRYEREQAWTWEHQALLRARPVAGDAALCAAFRAASREVLARPRDPARLRADVAEMRERMRREIARVAGEGEFDVKSDPGGITDLEFLVQYWVLAHAHTHPSLLDWPDVIRLLEGLAREALVPAATCDALADSYRALRGAVHACNLQGEPAVAPAGALVAERALVSRLWAETFGL